MTRSGDYGFALSTTATSLEDAIDYCATNYPGSHVAMVKTPEMRGNVTEAIQKLSGTSKFVSCSLYPSNEF